MPDRGEHFVDVRPRDLGDRHLADAPEREALQAAQPRPRVLRIAPTCLLLLDDPGRRFRKGRDSLRPALLRKRVPALAGQLPVGPRLLAGLGQRDEADAAESELTPAVREMTRR